MMRWMTVVGGILLTTWAYAAAWTPVIDDVYLQEVGYQIPTDFALNAVAVQGSEVFCGADTGLFRLEGHGTLVAVAGAPAGPILRLESIGGVIFAFTDAALHLLREGTWTALGAGRYYDVDLYLGETVVCSETQIFAVREGQLVPLPGADAPVKMRAIAPYAESLYCLGLDRLLVYDGKSIEMTRVTDFGAMPSKDLRDLLPMDNRLLVATYFGMGIVRGAAVTQLLGQDGLPYNACLALSPGFSGDYWIATPKGAVRVLKDEAQVFAAPRWLPHDQVHAIACGPHTTYVATSGGLGIIDYEPYTLAKKADFYERHLVEWGQKRMAFTHELHWDGNTNTWQREVSDNDLGWSTHYWAAQAFKWKATGDPVARQNMIDGFNALKWSEEITGIEGFPARAIWAPGETGIKSMHGSGGYDAEWHPSADGKFEWKGDTSSDETDAQLYFASIFHDLVDDPALQAKAKEHVSRIVGHIVKNGYRLIDVDGQPTVWGRWDPEYLSSWSGMYARGLNGLGILSYVATAQALTGEARFNTAMDDLVALGYPQYTLFAKHTTPEPLINHSDDRLAFYCYYTLLQYAKDPAQRTYYRRSLERSWEIERVEQNPWFNFIYGALTGSDCEVTQSVAHLRAWPLDLVSHAFDATRRDDLQPLDGYMPYAGGTRPISPRERGALRWSDNGMELGAGSGRTVRDPAGWLDAYWMGRYYGMIIAPTTQDPSLLTVGPPTRQLGALPYDGPPMPNVLGVR